MKKIKFDISHKDKIVSGQWKVITCHGEPVEIVKWNCIGQYPILACIFDGNTDDAAFYKENGDGMSFPEHNYLITLIDEPEESKIRSYENSKGLSEFEIVVGEACEDAMKQQPSVNPAIWAIGRQWTEKIYNAAEKLILGAYPAKQAYDLGFKAGKMVHENDITEQEK